MENNCRLIDANELWHKTFNCDEVAEVRKFIEQAPTVDAVEVVYCKDCDWYREDGSICVNPHCGKSFYGCRVREQHFCSYGERREGE